MKPMLKEYPYASMAIGGVRDHGGRSVTALTNAKTPQKKTNTQTETAIRWAVAKPATFASPSSITSNKMLSHCLAR